MKVFFIIYVLLICRTSSDSDSSESTDNTSGSSSGTSGPSTSTSGADMSNYMPLLVNETKSWEEALQHCRMFYHGLAYPSQDNWQVKPEIASAQTAGVWMGLRFLDGTWYTLNGKPMREIESLPSCPVPHFRCGAQNKDTHSFENRDCSERLNFICFSESSR